MTPSPEQPDARAHVPLTPVVLHILLALAEDEQGEGRHGYAVAQSIDALTGGQVRMGAGTLYGSIQRMLNTHLIEEVVRHRAAPRTRAAAAGAAADDDSRRRYYRLTTLGRRVLALEITRLSAVVRQARRTHVVRDPEPA